MEAVLKENGAAGGMWKEEVGKRRFLDGCDMWNLVDSLFVFGWKRPLFFSAVQSVKVWNLWNVERDYEFRYFDDILYHFPVSGSF